jgi:hypothetical protein
VPRVVRVERSGADKPNAFTICIVANPFIERPAGSGIFFRDPILRNYALFQSKVIYIIDCLFGNLPNQGERVLADPAIEPHVRIVSIFDDTIEDESVTNSLIIEKNDDIVEPRRRVFNDFLKRYEIKADVVFAVTASETAQRSSAWYASDDDGVQGQPFTLDGVTYLHAYESRIPGTIALHSSARSLTALHEFSHAISSFSNGMVVDLYTNNAPAVNSKFGNIPNPPVFCEYNSSRHSADALRRPLGYGSLGCFYSGLNGTAFPALMDDFWLEPSGAYERCEHDTVTRSFIRDRVLTKINRP